MFYIILVTVKQTYKSVLLRYHSRDYCTDRSLEGVADLLVVSNLSQKVTRPMTGKRNHPVPARSRGEKKPEGNDMHQTKCSSAIADGHSLGQNHCGVLGQAGHEECWFEVCCHDIPVLLLQCWPMLCCCEECSEMSVSA